MTSSPTSLENLTPDTAYEIQIRAFSTIGSGPYSDIEIFGAHSGMYACMYYAIQYKYYVDILLVYSTALM